MAVLRDLIAAHALRFERPVRGTYDAATGTRLLIGFVLVALVLHPALQAATRRFPDATWTGPALVLALLVAIAIAMKAVVRAPWSTIGLHAWSRWTSRERLYALTVIPMAAVVFTILFRGHFESLAREQGLARMMLVTMPTGLLWGFVQEVMYRGLLQTEWVRRIGSVPGVLLANVVFTFGPLHWMYFRLGTGAAPRWDMFGAIFGIGLLFGILYRRSGNLWIPALMHGMWPLNMR